MNQPLPTLSIPAPLRVVIQTAIEASGGNRTEFRSFWDTLFGFSVPDSWLNEPLENSAQGYRYPTTPPELFVIADISVDAAHAGYLVLAPELDQQDFPIGCFCEIDGDGLLFGGRNSRHFIEMRLSACLHCWDEMERDNTAEYSRQKIEKAAEFSQKMNEKAAAQRTKYAPHIESISAELEISPRADATVHWWGTGKADLNMPHPEVPAGYIYLPTPDHVGVLAAKELFDPSFSPEFATGDCLRAARLFRKRGFPASALWCLKQGAWECAGSEANYLRPARRWWTPSENAKLIDELMETYEALNRPLMVQSIQATLANS